VPGPRRVVSRAVLFDLDGTLVDSFPGIASAYRHVLTEMGLGDKDDADLAPLMGPPIQEGLQHYFGLSGTRLEEGIRIFREHYGSHGLFRFAKYTGVDEMLIALRDEDFELCLATSKLQSLATDVIGHAGWADLFSVIGGADPDGTRYRKTDVIAWTMTQMTSGAAAVAMVGDRAADIVGGRALGLPGIGVTWGYGSVGELDDAGAMMTVDSPPELLSILRGLD
jgi:phosphoglycolate phosphatase